MSLRYYVVVAVLLALATACGLSPQSTPDVKNIPPTDTPEKPQMTPTPPETGEQGGQAPASPLDPIPGEEKMVRGSVFIDSTDILLLESFPVQVNLKITGNLPTPCHTLRAKVSEPNENREIHVELYSLTDAGAICIQVLQPFETSIPLGSYESGEYTIYVNREEVGKVDL